MLFIQAAASLVLIFCAYVYLSFRKRVRDANNYPGIRQVVSGLHWLSLFNVIKVRYTSKGAWTFKYKDLYTKGSSVLTIISYDITSFNIADADIIKEITTTRKEFFPKPIQLYNTINLFGLNVVTTEDEIWKRHRRVASVGFSEKNYKLVHRKTAAYTSQLLDEIETLSLSKYNVGIYMIKLTLCVICSTAFGIESSWLNDEVIKKGHKMTFFSAIDTLSSNLIPVSVFPRWLLPYVGYEKPAKALSEFESYLDDLIAVKKQELKSVKNNDSIATDLFTSLIKAADEERQGSYGKSALSDSELRGNIYVMLLAGHETTAHTLQFALILLAINQDAQQKLYEEVITLFKTDSKEPAYEDIQTFKYTLAVFYETLRMFPTVPAIPKWAPNDTTIDNGNIKIPAGSLVTIHVTGLHYNPKYWGPDPEAFRPERFLGPYNKDAFVPFSDGARACLGRKFSHIEFVTCITMIIKRYKISVPKGDSKESLLEAIPTITLAPINPSMLAFELRD